MHTGETFDKASSIRLNAEYPGFERLVVEELMAVGERAVVRCLVTATVDGQRAHFEVATFTATTQGQIVAMTDLWVDAGQAPPDGTRPTPG